MSKSSLHFLSMPSILVLAIAASVRGREDSSWIEDNTVRLSDTLQMRISSSLGRPLRYRVQQSKDTASEHWLRLELQYPKVQSLVWRRKAGDKRYQSLDDGVVQVTIPMKKLAAWKIGWQESDLVLSWISPEIRPVWKNPWLMAGVGGAVAGGVAILVLNSNSHTAPPQAEEGAIPPPDIVLPR